MKSITFAVCSVLVLAGTLGAGWMHASLTHAWGSPHDMQRAFDRLDRAKLPQQMGDWRFDRDVPFTADVLHVLQQPAHLSKVYENMRTGDIVTVAVIAGHPGPVAVHTPEICFSSRDYQMGGERSRQQITAGDERAHDFWKIGFNPRDPGDLPLTVLYGWSTGTTWEAATHPRYSYGGLSHLYKIQLAVSTATDSTSSASTSSADAAYDPAADFLTQFLSHLQPLLVESNQRQKTTE
jgi:hypothetical protein